MARDKRWAAWERLFCLAVNALMPRILDDLVEASGFHRFLQQRRPEQRLRVAGHDGRLSLWNDTVNLEDNLTGAGHARRAAT